MVARVDRTTDPAIAAGLLLARRGQSFFSRALNGLSDEDFDGPSLLEGWDRRHLIAHVGLNARALTHLTEWASTGIETPMYASPTERNEDIEFTSTLPPQALRNLSDHAAIHLNVEWRDLPDALWSAEVRTAQGRVVPVSETIWMRAREVWIHAVDLGSPVSGTGASFDQFPPALVDALLKDVLVAWDRRRVAEDIPSFTLVRTDRVPADAPAESDGDALTLYGTAAHLASWATGRSSRGVLTSTGAAAPPAPRWL